MAPEREVTKVSVLQSRMYAAKADKRLIPKEKKVATKMAQALRHLVPISSCDKTKLTIMTKAQNIPAKNL